MLPARCLCPSYSAPKLVLKPSQKSLARLIPPPRSPHRKLNHFISLRVLPPPQGGHDIEVSANVTPGESSTPRRVQPPFPRESRQYEDFVEQWAGSIWRWEESVAVREGVVRREGDVERKKYVSKDGFDFSSKMLTDTATLRLRPRTENP